MTLSVEELTAYFQSCGFSEMRAVESAKGKAGAQAHAFFVANELEKKGTTDKQGHFALAIAKEVKLGEAERSYALEAVVDGRLKAVDQVTGESIPLLSIVAAAHPAVPQLHSSTLLHTQCL